MYLGWHNPDFSPSFPVPFIDVVCAGAAREITVPSEADHSLF